MPCKDLAHLALLLVGPIKLVASYAQKCRASSTRLPKPKLYRVATATFFHGACDQQEGSWKWNGRRRTTETCCSQE